MITLTDLFCGAGGSSEGAIQVPGVEVTMASNHWDLAVATHNSNHQNTDHVCADLSQITPAYFPTTDILWASPECTNHSQAKGVKRVTQEDRYWGEQLPQEAAERSRATMWDVVRFSEHHRYKVVIVENVIEAAKWVLFEPWLAAMHRLGYDHQIVCLNSMHATLGGMPAPQSRDRLYVMFHQRSNKAPDVSKATRPVGQCSSHGVVAGVQHWKKPGTVVGRYRTQYVYRCPRCAEVIEPFTLGAVTFIDWNLRGQRIGDRARPLSTKTRRRIAAGIARYWTPLVIEAAGSTYDAADPKHVSYGKDDAYYRAWPVSEPVKTIHTTMSKGLVVPVEGREGKEARPVEDPLRTQTARNESGLAFMTHLKGSSDSQVEGSHSPVTDPLHTVAAGGNHHALITSYYGTKQGAKPVTQPVDTMTATDRHALLTPSGGTWNEDARPVDEPVRTMTTRESQALVMRNNEGGAEMTTLATEPARTITTAGHQSILEPGDIAGAELLVDEVLFRMLEPAECKRAMAFGGDYVMLGTKRQQVRLAGNAVTPPASRDLVAVAVESLS